MKIAIATCQKLPQGVKEDIPLFDALAELDIEFDIMAWDAAVDWSIYDACLLRSVWDYHQRTEAFNNWLNTTAKLTRILNSPELVLWNQNKNYLAELADFGITIAPTEWLSHKRAFDLIELMAYHPADTYFLKPVLGADSSGTLRFKSDSAGVQQAQAHLKNQLPIHNMMLQPYLKSVETWGETSAIYFSGQFSHAVRKIPVTGDYRVQDTFGGTDTNYHLNPAELTLSKACLQFLSDKFTDILYARFDFLQGDNGTVYLNEAELIEPSLFFNHNQSSAIKMAQDIKNMLRNKTPVENNLDE